MVCGWGCCCCGSGCSSGGLSCRGWWFGLLFEFYLGWVREVVGFFKGWLVYFISYCKESRGCIVWRFFVLCRMDVLMDVVEVMVREW